MFLNSPVLDGSLLVRAILDPSMDLEDPSYMQENMAILTSRIKKLSQKDRADLNQGLTEIASSLREAQATNLNGLNNLLKQWPERALCVLLLTDDGVVVQGDPVADVCSAMGSLFGAWNGSQALVNTIKQVRLELIRQGANPVDFSYDDMVSCLSKFQGENQTIEKRLEVAKKNKIAIDCLSNIQVSKEKIEENRERITNLMKSQPSIELLQNQLTVKRKPKDNEKTLDDFSKFLEEFLLVGNTADFRFMDLDTHLHAISPILSERLRLKDFEDAVTHMKTLLGNFNETYLSVGPSGIKYTLNSFFEPKEPGFLKTMMRQEFFTMTKKELIQCYLEAVSRKFQWECLVLEGNNNALQEKIVMSAKVRAALLSSVPVEKPALPPRQPVNAPKQRIVVKCNAGPDNWICVTGEGPDMNSWGIKIPLFKDPSDKDTWFYEIPEGAAKFEYKFTLHKKDVLGFEWEEKTGNYTRDPAQKGQVEHVIKFSSSSKK